MTAPAVPPGVARSTLSIREYRELTGMAPGDGDEVEECGFTAWVTPAQRDALVEFMRRSGIHGTLRRGAAR